MPIPLKWSAIRDEWEVEDGRVFTSRINAGQLEQLLIFGERIKNGSLTVDITPLETQKTREGEESREGNIIFRYANHQNYHYAGIGGFGAKFCIAKNSTGRNFQLLGSIGNSSSIEFNKTYRLQVVFEGSRVSLFDNGVQQLVIIDETYQEGQWGLQTWKSRVKFEIVDWSLSKPACFVIMPFKSELDFVWGVIKETVQAHGIECLRADEKFISQPVVEDLKYQIAEADLVIVDFTDKNPNVYYEAGIADALKKKWIVLAQSQDDLTFDVRHIRTILYSNRMGADIRLRENLSQAIRETMGFGPIKTGETAPRSGEVLPAPKGGERVSYDSTSAVSVTGDAGRGAWKNQMNLKGRKRK
jgi:hypothetical protein